MKLSKIERKLYGALLVLSDDKGMVYASHDEIAKFMGYSSGGGALSQALTLLEIKNYIVKVKKGEYKVLFT